MNNVLRTVILSAFFISFSAVIMAQTYRLEAGYVSRIQKGSNVSPTYLSGVRLGGTLEIPLKKFENFSLLTGALYEFVYSDKIQKYPGYTNDFEDEKLNVNYRVTSHSLNIPLRLTYTLPVNKSLKFIGFAGPNFNVGLAQKQRVYLDGATQEYIDKMGLNIHPGNYSLYNDNDKNELYLSRLNVQLGAGAGVQWKQFQLKAGYDWGLNDLSKRDYTTIRQKGWYLTLSVGL